jgi:hypothetical protein
MNAPRALRAGSVDNSAWDAGQAWSNGASSDDPAAFYDGICAGKKAGDPATQAAHALPHHYHPSDPPNAAGVKNSLSRLPQTQGLTNKAAAQAHLEAHMKVINPDYEPSSKSAPSRADLRSLRAERLGGSRRGLPGEAARLQPFRATFRAAAAPVMLNGKKMRQLDGYASITGIEYEMWDMFGPYGETVAPTAFDKTLAANPDVAFLVNHRGLTMARTVAAKGYDPTLLLDADPRGLHMVSYLNPERTDVSDLLIGIDDQNVTEMSFAFMITDGGWDEEYMHFSIDEVDLDRGDVSAVNYGANPYTSIEARAREVMADMAHLPAGAQRQALTLLSRRFSGTRAADGDTDVKDLIASLDGTLDEMSQLVSGADLTGLPEPVAQAVSMIAGAESIVDNVMDLMGIFDPDDEADAGEAAAAGAPGRHNWRGRVTGTTYADVSGDEITVPEGTLVADVARRAGVAQGGRSVDFYEQMLRLDDPPRRL